MIVLVASKIDLQHYRARTTKSMHDELTPRDRKIDLQHYRAQTTKSLHDELTLRDRLDIFMYNEK